MTISAEFLTRTSELEALRPDWQALAARVPDASPYQSPAWLLPWWRHRGNGRLRTVALRRDDRLAAVLPLWRDDAGVLRFVGDGDCDVQDALVAPEEREDASRLLLRCLGRLPDGFSGLLLDRLPPRSPLLAADPPTGCGLRIADDGGTALVPLADGLPDDVRMRIDALRRRAEREKGMRVEPAGHDSRDRILSIAQEMAQRVGCCPDGVAAALHREVAAGFQALSRLRLHLLWIDHRPSAVFYGFAGGREQTAHLVVADQAAAAYAPALLVAAHAAEAARAEGAAALRLRDGGAPPPEDLGGRRETTMRLEIVAAPTAVA
jgi:hypothetical protein